MSKKTEQHEDGDFGEAVPPRKISAFAWLRGRFFAGMVIVAPIVVTFLLLQYMIAQIDSRIVPLLPAALKPETYLNYAVPGFGLLVLIFTLTIIGAIATNLIGRSIIRTLDRFLSTVPIVRNVYSAFKQLVDVLATNHTSKFDEVVLIEYPRKGCWCVGFVASSARGEIGTRLTANHIGVFVPTTPNPTSGFLMYVEPSEVIRMDMSVEDGAKMILSAGLVVPEHMPLKKGERLPEGQGGASDVAEETSAEA